MLTSAGIAHAQVAVKRPDPRPNPPKADEITTVAVFQETEGSVRKLRGHARVDTAEMRLEADEIDYDEERQYAEARGHVKFDHYVGGEHIEADRVEYNLDEETGRYYDISGFSPAKVETRPGVLTTSNPFSFQGKWAERFQDRYVLHDGMVTDCKLPVPWWTLRGPTFDIVPGDRAIAHNTIFWVRRVPIFYSPYFYRSLKKAPRKSGFLMPNIGNSSRRGKMVGVGYYWAISRSFDATYRTQWYTDRGFAHHLDFRGKPTAKSDFDAIIYGVNDSGRPIGTNAIAKEGGWLATVLGKADLGDGFLARTEINYLSSFQFRQAFTESFYEAVFTESHSIGFITKHWNTFDVNFVGSRIENFYPVTPVNTVTGNETVQTYKDNKIVIRKLPMAEFNSREHELFGGFLPLYFSLDSSGGFLNRNQEAFTTRNWVERVDFEPKVTTTMAWRDFHITPSFSFRETSYGSSRDETGKIVGNDVLRSSREFDVDFTPPALAKIYNSPKWLGKKLKHVIETDAKFRYVTGIDDFQRYVLFDETELESNTNEVEVSLTNRIYSKRKDDRVDEVLSWRVAQRRFFDPTFGGAIIPGERNVLLSSATFTGYTFLDRPRNYSPVVSVLRLSPDYRVGIEWRTDYDPLFGHIVNSSITADVRVSKYFMSLGHDQVRSVYLTNGTQLSPNSNQLRGRVGFGQENKRGWNSAFEAIYDYRQKVLQYATTQITYNTDCCGWSVQYRRFSFGSRNENQFRLAFAIANIGSFGTLKRQERMF